MKNWAGNLQFYPEKSFSPSSVEEIKKIILDAKNTGKRIRLRGSGHSWTGLIETKDYYLDLDNLQGALEVHEESAKIKALAGTKLYRFGDEGFKYKLSMENQGDINLQSLAGATSTGTHGTGITLQSVANQIDAMTILNAKAEEVVIDSHHPYFNAARLSLGALGIITDLTLKLRPAYKLKVESFAESMDEALKHFDERLKSHRHLEMFFFPVGEWSLTKFMDETKEDPRPKTWVEAKKEKLIENWLYIQLNRLAASTKQYEILSSLVQKFVTHETRTDWSHRAFPTERSIKFMEMEYNLPFEKFGPVLEEIRRKIKDHKFQTLLPIEIRFVKNDPIWLSPAFERDSVYFAVHTYITEDYKPYFDCMEEIFKSHGGRPHWGKWHTMKASEFEKVYPKFHDFKKVRQEFDPEGLFLNSHLKEVFGL